MGLFAANCFPKGATGAVVKPIFLSSAVNTARYFCSATISLNETSMMKKVSSRDIMSPYVTTHSGTPGGASSSIV